MADGSTGPLADDGFGRLLNALGPFERSPRIAVAVSGGSDSLALLLLAHRWARGLGGSAVALTVDHGLRPESREEAARVGMIVGRHGIAHACLKWIGAKPSSGIQAAARAVRYRLLEDWCAREGVLHLLLGHHLEDQAETFLLRLGRGSGVVGLAGMAPIVERRHVRLLRPLLTVSKERLRATLESYGQEWIVDSSNANRSFARVRLRDMAAGLGQAGMTPRRLAAASRSCAGARDAIERETARAVATMISVYPEGYLKIERCRFAGLDVSVGLRVLSAIALTIGGSADSPRGERLQRLFEALTTDEARRGWTLGGCLFRAAGNDLMVFREPALVQPPLDVAGAGTVDWDGRFRVVLSGAGRATLRALGNIATPPGPLRRALRRSRIPAAARATLPSLWRDSGLLAVPHLGYGLAPGDADSVTIAHVRFAPCRPLQASWFTLV